MGRAALGRVCAVAGCGRPHAARGWCNRHYQRWLRWGSAEYEPPNSPKAGRVCRKADCGRPHHAKGLCLRCYQVAWWRRKRLDGTEKWRRRRAAKPVALPKTTPFGVRMVDEDGKA